ncbi:conserved hypothetical protein [Leishmania mexicana MHOM/GT/2001/U1103]|uniref:Uncharacterized protein n=1 Tax=Leishmania mexicana (strain MHOM/GT/2001/U1103) TaxID=929439 RepID=E9B463_LEIMU|nr:conserved hypothetical protein [Leishmania mexicana MHOM/GT/2001/U1103]CBZ30031.1 conserved hypothetical protein [Leishmania mexicana MHOM/GT/2001/U1103]
MNTRRKMTQAKPDVPSTHWHLMSEDFYPLFEVDRRQHVEYWYNMTATGVQRDIFRRICNAIYRQDPATPDPIFNVAFCETVELEQVSLLLKNYGSVLSDNVGKPKTRVWLLHCGKSSRDRNEFRSVFTGCQTTYERRSVMHTDYVAPNPASYPADRTHFVRSVNWTSLKTREAMLNLEAQRRANGGVMRSQMDKLASTIAGEQRRMNSDGKPMQRTSKPKNQFDGVNVLSSLGFDGVPAEEAVAQLKAKQNAHREAEWYYVDKDGSTVYKARPTKGPTVASVARRPERGEGGILASVTSEPMTLWVNKTCC